MASFARDANQSPISSTSCLMNASSRKAFDIVGDALIWSVRDGEILSERSRSEGVETAKKAPIDELQQTGAGGPVIANHPVDITIRASSVREDAEALRFDITLSPAPDQTLALIYTTMGKSPLAEQDYVSTQGVLRIPSGTEATSIEVPLLDDDLTEGDESVTLFVTTDPSVSHVGERQVEGIILDDD